MHKILFAMLLTILIALPVFAAEQVSFYHTDPAGTPLAITNSNGTVVWRADYKPFGEENTVTVDPKNNKRFVGKEKDEETGLSYFGARYEDAKTGRFIAVDPVRAVDEKTSKTNEKILLNPQRLNSYAYALNNPYRYVDMDGREVFLMARGLKYTGLGVHSFLLIIPDQPSDFGGEKIWTLSGYKSDQGKLATAKNWDDDTHWSAWENGLKGIVRIAPPNRALKNSLILSQ